MALSALLFFTGLGCLLAGLGLGAYFAEEFGRVARLAEQWIVTVLLATGVVAVVGGVLYLLGRG